MKSHSKIWICGSTGASDAGTRFHHLIVAATTEPIIGSTQHKIFYSVGLNVCGRKNGPKLTKNSREALKIS